MSDPWADLERQARGPLAAEDWQRWRELFPLATRAALPPVGSVREAHALGGAIAALLAQHPSQGPRVVVWLREQPRNSRRCLEALLQGALASRPAGTALAALLDLFETRVRWPDVAATLQGRPPQDLEPILERLRTGSPTVRRSAVRLLELYPGELTLARADLLRGLDDPEPGVVGRAALLLARTDPSSEEVRQALERAAHRPGLRSFAREAVRRALAPTGGLV